MTHYFPARREPMYDSPETLQLNPPSTWVVVKDAETNRRSPWLLCDMNGKTIDRFETKRDATESMQPGGFYAVRYEQEQAWFAGNGPAEWKTWAAVQRELAERKEAEARQAAAAERKVIRAGLSLELIASWAKALGGTDQAAIAAAAREMFACLTNGNLVDTDLLNEEEAARVTHELSESFGFGTSADGWLYRLKYDALDTDKTAVEILELMVDEERETRRLAYANSW